MNKLGEEHDLLSEQAYRVAVAWGPDEYHVIPPFSPGVSFPEYPFGREGTKEKPNYVYGAVRQTLHLLELDSTHYGSPNWNPLGAMIEPGQTVVIKPNLVRDFRETQPGDGCCLITHGSIIRAIVDYVYIALEGSGRIVIADAPQNDADFDQIRRMIGLDEIKSFYRYQAGFDVEVYDLRPERTEKINGVIVNHVPLPGDPEGYVRVNLGLNSAFAEINHLCHLLYGSEYDIRELHRHQHDDVHEYLISRTVLGADCLIGVPKLKTHKKTGITVNLKNLVGINGNKNWLPHHREGTLIQGGDQFAECGLKQQVEQTIVAWFKRLFPMLGPIRPVVAAPVKKIGTRLFGDTNTDTVRSGNWYGNDTTWRMVLDLNRILMYADENGRLQNAPVRKFFSVVDGIIGGEGNGPLDAVPKKAGLVLAGANPVAVDLACAYLMGFDYRKIPMLYRALDEHPFPLIKQGVEQIVARSDRAGLNRSIVDLARFNQTFQPHFGWRGYIELKEKTDETSVIA